MIDLIFVSFRFLSCLVLFCVFLFSSLLFCFFSSFCLVDEICQARIRPNGGLKPDLGKVWGKGKNETQTSKFDTQRFKNQRMLLNYVPVSQDEALDHARQRVYNPRSLPRYACPICMYRYVFNLRESRGLRSTLGLATWPGFGSRDPCKFEWVAKQASVLGTGVI
ncbi:uncharacterized protein GGS22DRAFT_98861 [Annulohypoxylon maeteangense]|uniref:uncharacterized protein n=1 Tax=Annulohypoxylon maeteangense TaxID=1927788 RepID=UPI002008D937|nr:uncharacterized protein GGS22DRAFT_98861 [Annulohypoxylon maeteangense]KAI0880171.1 hypothetical protein GGS22DRAFT_98861 [Annulohypoxylon maeteangense]